MVHDPIMAHNAKETTLDRWFPLFLNPHPLSP